MKKIFGLLIFTGMFTLAGCGEAQEPTYDEEYYKTHDTERLAKLDWCKGNAERKQTFNCRNAGNARAQLSIETMLGEGFPRTK